MKLSDSEKRDICNLIEQGINLPEKYRFLLFGESNQVELKWNGKTDEVTNVVLPFQIIEQIDEPRSEIKQFDQGIFDLFKGRQKSGWTNKLIWGDNKYILSSLKNGPMRDEIEDAGGIKLIYIDPPFDTSADFSLNIGIGDENSYEKEPNVLEHIAYRDTWGKGDDSFLSMIYERLLIARDLLSEDGSIYFHCDYRVTAQIRLILNEIFGKENYVNEIIWQGSPGSSMNPNKFIKTHDTILLYRKNIESFTFNPDYIEMGKDARAHYRNQDEKGIYRWDNCGAPGKKGYVYDLGFGEVMPRNAYRMPKEKALEMIEDGRLKVEANKVPVQKRYLKNEGKVPAKDVWLDIKSLQNNENLNYPTQKPEKLLERIIKCSSNENDIVFDFFAGSGSTASVAEKLGRKWICADLGKFSIHAIRKRMIGVQRELKKSSKNWRSFEVLNLGKYQRELFLSDANKIDDDISFKNQKLKMTDFENLIFEAYKVKKVNGFNTLHGTKGEDFVSLGPVNQPLSRNHIEEVIEECLKNKIVSVHVLGFEYEMGLFPTIQEEAKLKGLRLKYKQIPIEIFDKRAVDKGEVIFHDVAYIDFKCHLNQKNVSVELTDFTVFYNENNLLLEENLRPGRSKVVVEQGQIIEKSKNKDGEIKEKTLTREWHNWIDYWSVDFNYESKKEIIKFQDDNGLVKEKWTGNFIFENEWQSFRTKLNKNNLELKTTSRILEKDKIKIAVKVIDIFGNDTMKVVEVSI